MPDTAAPPKEAQLESVSSDVIGRSSAPGNCEPVSLQPSQRTSKSFARSKRQERNAEPECREPPSSTPVSTHPSNTQRRVTSSESDASSNRHRVNVTPESSVQSHSTRAKSSSSSTAPSSGGRTCGRVPFTSVGEVAGGGRGGR